MQKHLNLADWRGLALPSTDKRRKESVKSFEHLPSVWTDRAKLKETLATLQTAENEEEADGKSSTIAKHKGESDASPMEFH